MTAKPKPHSETEWRVLWTRPDGTQYFCKQSEETRGDARWLLENLRQLDLRSPEKGRAVKVRVEVIS